VVEALAADAAEEPLADGVGARRGRRRGLGHTHSFVQLGHLVNTPVMRQAPRALVLQRRDFTRDVCRSQDTMLWERRWSKRLPAARYHPAPRAGRHSRRPTTLSRCTKTTRDFGGWGRPIGGNGALLYCASPAPPH
jgi:hypothetical protein